MKRTVSKVSAIPFLLFWFVLISGCIIVRNQGNTDNVVQSEYNLAELNNDGEWVQINVYGRVWRPYVVNDWAPFENGHWIYADGSWTWVSYEPFGWIVYHYGNWYNDPYYGWVWIPSDDPWSPARVEWIEYYDYIGWAPLPPAGVVYGNSWDTRNNRYWHIVRRNDFTNENIWNYRVKDPVRNEEGSRAVIYGQPQRGEIEKSTGRRIREIDVRREPVSGSGKRIERMNLPEQERVRVEQNSRQVRNRVILPRDEYQKQHKRKKEEPRRKERKR